MKFSITYTNPTSENINWINNKTTEHNLHIKVGLEKNRTANDS